MTMDVAMGLVSAVSARGNDRGGKSGADAGAFDRALSEKPAKRALQNRQPGEPAAEPRWKPAATGGRSAPTRQEPEADAAYDSFRELLLPLAAAGPADGTGESVLEADLPEDGAAQPAERLPTGDAAPQAPAAVAAQSPASEGTRDATPDMMPNAMPDAGDRRPARGQTDAVSASPRRATVPASASAAGPTIGPAIGPAGNRAARPTIAPAAGPDAGLAADDGNPPAAAVRAQTAEQVSAAPMQDMQDRPAVEGPRQAEGRPGRPATPAAPQVRAAVSAPVDAGGGAPASSGQGMPEDVLRQLEAVQTAGRAGAASAPPRAEATTPAPAGADKPQPVVSVLGFSTSSAPVVPANIVPANLASQLSATGAGVVAAIEAEPTWRAAAAEAAPQRGQTAGVVSSLRIQLNPAELGMVTARLVATGSQLEIEIRVESNDARQKLAHDADAIVKALRGVGYDIERVTIQQAPQGSPGTQQQAQQQGAASRDPFMQQGQQQDQAGANAGGRNGQNSGNGATAAQRNAGEPGAERAGGSVYI